MGWDMSEGAWIVCQNPADPQDIQFSLKSGVVSVPEDQLTLKELVEKSLTVLRRVYASDNAKFATHYNSLLAIAQTGLVGSTANPNVATRALATFKADIVSREGIRVKNEYLIALGSFAFIFVCVATISSALALRFFPNTEEITSIAAMWIGCMGGVWLSFALGKAEIEFDDLHLVELSHKEPLIRLIFAGFLSMVLWLICDLKVLVLSVGQISTEAIVHNFKIALVFGLFSGLSEKALSSAIRKKVGVVFSE